MNKTCRILLEMQVQTHVTFFYGPLHMDGPVMAGHQELIYISCVHIQGVVWKTYMEQWMRGTDGEKESGKSVLSARLDDDWLDLLEKQPMLQMSL